MALKFGSNEVSDLKWGARNVLALYQGATKLWERSVIPSIDYLKYLGQSFTAYNTQEGETNNLKVMGKTVQDEETSQIESTEISEIEVKTVGKNLFDKDNGEYGFQNEDGTLNRPTSDNDWRNVWFESSTIIPLANGKTYYSSSQCSYKILDKNKDFIRVLRLTGTSTYTPSDNECYAYVAYARNASNSEHFMVTDVPNAPYTPYQSDALTIELDEPITLADGEYIDFKSGKIVREDTQEDLPSSVISQLRQLDTYTDTTHVYLTTDSNVPAEIEVEILTDEVGMAEFETVSEALEDLGVTPTEYHNVNKDMLAELGVE